MMQPVAKLLIRYGITYQEFDEIARLAFVESVEKDYQLRDKKMTDSRVALLTGLTRREVKRVRDMIVDGEIPEIGEHYHRASRVLSGWFDDELYCGPDGETVALPMEGDISFTSLVKAYGKDVPATVVLEELQRVGAIVIDDATQLINATTRAYISDSEDDIAGVRLFGTAMHDLANTIQFNLDAKRIGSRRLQRSVLNTQLDPDMLNKFQELAAERGAEFLVELDSWLSKHELAEHEVSANAKAKRTGVGLFFFHDD